MAEADNGLGHKVWVNKYDTKIVTTEDESALSKGGVTPVVINEDETNMWGSPRGYKASPICPGGGEGEYCGPRGY
jgi:hypothetical protein